MQEKQPALHPVKSSRPRSPGRPPSCQPKRRKTSRYSEAKQESKPQRLETDLGKDQREIHRNPGHLEPCLRKSGKKAPKRGGGGSTHRARLLKKEGRVQTNPFSSRLEAHLFLSIPAGHCWAHCSVNRATLRVNIQKYAKSPDKLQRDLQM